VSTDGVNVSSARDALIEVPEDSHTRIRRNSEGTEFYAIHYSISPDSGISIEAAYRFDSTIPVQSVNPMPDALAIEKMKHRSDDTFVPLGGRLAEIIETDEREKIQGGYSHEIGIFRIVFERQGRMLSIHSPNADDQVELNLDWSDEELDHGILKTLGTAKGVVCVLTTHGRPNEARVLVVEDGALVRDITLELPRSMGYRLFGGWRSWLEVDGEGKHLMFINRWPPPPGLKSDAYVADLETGDITSVRTPSGKVLWGARQE
jgi:hypothetical protein